MITPLQIVSFYFKRGIKPENIPAKSVYGKIFYEWLNSTHELPEGYKFNQISLKDEVCPYELLYAMGNASDCVDWLKDNGKNLNDFLLPKINVKELLTNEKQFVSI